MSMRRVTVVAVWDHFILGGEGVQVGGLLSGLLVWGVCGIWG